MASRSDSSNKDIALTIEEKRVDDYLDKVA
jgi:hypothetical protein